MNFNMNFNNTPGLLEGRKKIEAGAYSCEQWLMDSRQVIRNHNPAIKALVHVDFDQALGAAREQDQNLSGGSLRGVPVAVKDVFDTADLPTEFNSPLHRGRRPTSNAACVESLLAAGAVLIGKAATVEFASVGRVAETVNPWDHHRTPGGSSSGSAAAVATGMAPVALATQTGGSTIRPASFCGVAAMKPSYGVVSVEGLRPYAPSLDTVGWMTRGVADLAAVANALNVFPGPEPSGNAPRIGFYRTPYWEEALPETRAALDWARARLAAAGVAVVDVDGPDNCDQLNQAQDTIMHGEGKAAYWAEYQRWPEQLHSELRREVENARGCSAADLRWAHDYLGAMRGRFDQAFAGFDAWLTPAVPGQAPLGLSSTGDAVFNRLWTGLHMPAVTLPGFRSEDKLPVGIQLVAPRFEDANLLRIAGLVEAALAG